MPGGLLNVFELRAVLQRRGDEGRAHRVRRVAAPQAKRCDMLPHYAVDCVRVHGTPWRGALSVVVQRPEQRPLAVAGVARQFQIAPDPRGGLRIDRQRVAPAPLRVTRSES